MKRKTNLSYEPIELKMETLISLFNEFEFVLIQKNKEGRIHIVFDQENWDRSLSTSCSKKGLTYQDKIAVCLNRFIPKEKP